MGKAPAKQEKNITNKIKESFEQPKESISNIMKEQPGMDNAQWVERLFQVNGNQMKLKYKALQGNNAGTNEFEFEGDNLKIDKWIQVEPSRLNGEVFSYDKEAQRELNYVSRGGWAEFKVPGTEEQKAQMLTISIVMPEEGESEVFFMLNEPVEIKFGEDFTVELEYGKYAKVAADSRGTMHFQDAKLYYKDKLVKESAQVECDETGVRFDGKSTLFFADLLPDKVNRTEEKQDKQNKEIDRLLDAGMFFDEEGAHFEVWENMFLHLNGKEIKLSYKPIKNGEWSTSQYRLDKEEWELQNGFKIYPKETGATITEKKENSGKDKTVNFWSWRGGKVSYKVPNLKYDKERKVPLEYLSVQMNPDKKVQIGFGISQSNAMVIPLLEDEYTLNIILQNGVYNEEDGGLKFWDSKVFYKGKLFGNIEALTSDENGLHMPGNGDAVFDKAIVSKKILDTDIMEQEDYDNLDNENLDIKVGLDFSEDEIVFFVLHNTIYRTLDKFAEIRDVEEETDEEGNVIEGGKIEGNLYLSDIPIFLFMNKKNKPKKEQAKAPDEPVEGVLVTEDKNDEQKFSAKKEKPISVTYDLVELEVETGSGTTTYAKKVTLDGIEVKDGILTVEKVTIENALGREQESEDEAKEIFNCKVSGSIIHSSDSVEFSQDGLVATEGKTTLGTLSIEDFLGFLSGEVNYPEGKIHVSAGKEKEADPPTILTVEKQKLGDGGISIPIPATGGMVSAKFFLTPHAKIGGSVSLDAARGKSLGEKWEENDKLDLGGEVKLNGEAGLDAGAGLEAGVSYLANIDLVLTASLLATLNAGISMNTGLKMVVEKEGEKEKKHFEQAEDINVAGEMEAKLQGSISLGSNVKLLFWKKKLFELELYSQTLGAIQVSMEARKKKGYKGLTSGWEMVNKKGFAESMAKSMDLSFKDKKGKAQELEAKRQKILTDAKGEAEDAWSALLELEKNNKECYIMLKEEEQKKLAPQMEKMKQDVENKINTYKKLLESEKKRTEQKKKEAQGEHDIQKNILEKAIKDMNLPDEFRDMALLGGLREENYAEADIETTSIDFIIYKALGEVSKENLDKKTKKYHNTRNWEQTKDEHYHEATLFGTRYNEDAAEKYRQGMSYYRVLSSKVSSLNGDGKNKENRVPVPHTYTTIVKENPDMTIKELLQMAIEDRDKEGNRLGATAKEKEQLLEACFNFKFTTSDVLNIKGKGKMKASEAWLKEMDDVVNERLGRKDLTLRGIIEAAKKNKVHESIASARIKMAQADNRIKSANEKIVALEKQMLETDHKIVECKNKLDMLKQSAVGALKDKKFDVNLARQAINIYADDYLGKMKPESDALEKAGAEEMGN